MNFNLTRDKGKRKTIVPWWKNKVLFLDINNTLNTNTSLNIRLILLASKTL